MRVALATAAEARGLDTDEPLLVDALASRGVEAVPAVWDDPAVDWGAFALVVVRSTWDYAPRRKEFLAWAEHVASLTALRNTLDVLRWNTDKRYLRRLAALDVPVVPTTWVPVGSPPALPQGEVVVKPAVSAGGRDTTRYTPGQRDQARAHVARLHAEGREVMVQPYLPEIEAGEVALVYSAGRYSHALRKVVRLRAGSVEQALFSPEQLVAYEPPPALRALGDRALAALVDDPHGLLYARVDVVETGDGAGLLMEVELTEPSLFLPHAPGAAARFAAAIAAAAGG